MGKEKPIILKKRRKAKKVVDVYESQLKELSEITFGERKKAKDAWVYYPWNGVLLHTLNQKDLNLLRTNRNQNLITSKEQKKLFDFTVGVVGLSVGGNVATNLAYSGISNSMKLADYDTLETTNLNRVQAKLSDVGDKKINVITRKIYEINPFANLVLFPDGLNEKNLADFINKKPKPKLIFEIIDDFEMKVKLRLEARKAGVPVIMLSNLGDSILVDIERYDLNRDLQIFNGRVGDLPKDKDKAAIEIVGKENVPQKALESVKMIGKTLVGRPQLMSTVTVSSGIAAFLTRKIALGGSVPSERKLVNFEKFIF